jgi:hypothetical protein
LSSTPLSTSSFRTSCCFCLHLPLIPTSSSSLPTMLSASPLFASTKASTFSMKTLAWSWLQ